MASARARQQGLQAAVVGLEFVLAVVPLGQRNAGAERNVVLGRGWQVEVEAHLGGDALAVVVGQRELVDAFGGGAGIRVLVVVGGAIDAHEFGPRQDALGAEHHDHRRFVFRQIHALGLVLLALGLFLFGAGGFRDSGLAPPPRGRAAGVG